MTQVHFIGGFGSGNGFLNSFRRVIALIAAFGVGVLVLMAAGVLAITTAIVGLIIAFVAMLLRAGAYRGAAKTVRPQAKATPGDEPVLEARRTARGWTVDG